MKLPPGAAPFSSLLQDLGAAAGPAARSTLIIAAVALAAFALRAREFQLEQIKSAAKENGCLILPVFAVVFAWEYWRQRTKRKAGPPKPD